MKKSAILTIILFLFFFCSPKGEKVERIIEDGVEVVINHREPYELKGESSTLTLEEELIIDTEREDLAEVGIGEFPAFDVDSSGNIYLWTQRSPENFIFKFDKNGNFLKSFGRVGQGPGEMQFVVGVSINRDDEIMITESRRSKLITLDTDGIFVDEKSISNYISMVIPLCNEKYLAGFYEYSPEAEYNHSLMVLYSSDFERIKELDRAKRENIILAKSIEGVSHGRVMGITPSNIYLGYSGRGYEIWVYDLEGNFQRKIRKDYLPVPVTEEYKKKYLKRYERAPDEIRKKIYFPKHQPPFQMGFSDDEGRLFVMTYEKGERPNTYKYDIFNTSGVFIGRTSLENYGQYGTSDSPLYAMAKKDRLYYIRQKESGFKELAVYNMKWE